MRHLHTAPSPESRVSLCLRATELPRLRFASRSTWLAPLAAALLLGAASAASAQTYSFVSIADNTGPFVDFQVPSINNAGTVVFNAFLAGGEQRIVTGPDPVTDVIATTAGPYDIFEFALPVINDAGTALFLATLDAGGEGYFTGPDPVADAFITSAGPFDFFFGPAINNTGTAVVHAVLDDGSEGLFTGPNPATDTVVSTNGKTYAFFGNPSINNAGTVAFVGARSAGGQAIATGPNPADIVANTDGNYFGFADPDINDAGRVVFIASLDDGSYSGIFDGPDPVADAVITTQGPYRLVTDLQSLNNKDLLVFGASLDSAPKGKGIFTGPDPVADKIIYTGDALFGSTLTNFFFNKGLNDRGDVAFFYELADGRIGIALAAVELFRSVTSRKTHGSAGTFDINLPIGGPVNIEDRSGGNTGNHTMVFTFLKPVASVGARNVTGQSGSPSIVEAGTGPGPQANQYTVNLTGVNNAQTISVTLSNVTDTEGGVIPSATGTMGVLLGDVDQNRSVDGNDVSAVQARTRQPVDSSNFKADVNASGQIDGNDVSLTQSQTGTILPSQKATSKLRHRARSQP